MAKATTHRRRDPEASRERLLRASMRLFSERGLDGASVDMIARASRLNRRMLYHYFGSKAGLYRAVLKRAYEQIASVEVELAHLLLPVEELLAKMVRAYYDFMVDHPEFVRLLTWENLRQGKAAREINLLPTKAPLIEALRLALTRGKQEGRFREDVDEKQLLISCMALSFFYFSNRHTLSRALAMDMESPAAVDRRVEHVVRLLLDGIRAHSAEIEKVST